MAVVRISVADAGVRVHGRAVPGTEHQVAALPEVLKLCGAVLLEEAHHGRRTERVGRELAGLGLLGEDSCRVHGDTSRAEVHAVPLEA
ncbi:MAG: hypothetical protein ACOY3F_08095 [Bacillota bacterium]